MQPGFDFFPGPLTVPTCFATPSMPAPSGPRRSLRKYPSRAGRVSGRSNCGMMRLMTTSPTVAHWPICNPPWRIKISPCPRPFILEAGLMRMTPRGRSCGLNARAAWSKPSPLAQRTSSPAPLMASPVTLLAPAGTGNCSSWANPSAFIRPWNFSGSSSNSIPLRMRWR